MTKKTIEERAQEFYDAVFDQELLRLMVLAEGEAEPTEDEQADGISDADDARQRIQDQGYSLQKETVYYVTLAGGGPAARLRVVTDQHSEVEEASLQFQDWFEPWTDAPNQDEELVMRYASLLAWYGE